MPSVTEIAPIAVGRCSGTRLLNGVATIGNGLLVVVNAACDAIQIVDELGEVKSEVGGKGLGKYLLKEPVGVFVSPADEIFVADWHNHRVVVYDKELTYLTEFGRYGKAGPEGPARRLRNLAGLLMNLRFPGTYLESHFVDDDTSGHLPHGARVSGFRLLSNGVGYWAAGRGVGFKRTFRALYSTGEYLWKPNGVAFMGDRIAVSEKNNRCVSFYRRDSGAFALTRRQFSVDGERRFGRLGNVYWSKRGILFVCDEAAGVVWEFEVSDSDELRLRNSILGEDSGFGTFAPFSCVVVGERYLCVCGGANVQLIDLETRKVVYRSSDSGELHGVAYDCERGLVFVADRYNSAIRRFEIVFA